MTGGVCLVLCLRRPLPRDLKHRNARPKEGYLAAER